MFVNGIRNSIWGRILNWDGCLEELDFLRILWRFLEGSKGVADINVV